MRPAGEWRVYSDEGCVPWATETATRRDGYGPELPQPEWPRRRWHCSHFLPLRNTLRAAAMQVLDVRSRHRGRLARQCAVVRVRGARFAVTRQRLGSRLTTVSGQTVCQGIGAPGTIARGGAPFMALATSAFPTMDFPTMGIHPYSLTGTATMRTHKLRKRNPTMVLQGRLRKNLLATKDIHSRGLRTRQKPTP